MYLPFYTQVDLMRNVCHALLYTPSGEHFGIVPLEAMHCRLPVVAVNDAGPKESVADGVTGFLCQVTCVIFWPFQIQKGFGGCAQYFSIQCVTIKVPKYICIFVADP